MNNLALNADKQPAFKKIFLQNVLPHYIRDELRAFRIIAQHANHIITIGQNEWNLSIEAQKNFSFLSQNNKEFEIEWAGAHFKLHLSRKQCCVWLAAQLETDERIIEDNEFPADLYDAAMQTIINQLLDVINISQIGPANLINVGATEKINGKNPWAYQFFITAKLAQNLIPHSIIFAQIATDQLGLMLLASFLEKLPVYENAIQENDLPISYYLTIGKTALTFHQIDYLKVGDVVLLDYCSLTSSPKIIAQAIGISSVVHLQINDGQVMVIGVNDVENDSAVVDSENTQYSVDNAQNSDENDEEQVISSIKTEHALSVDLNRVPVNLTFDLGTITMTLAEVKKLQRGQIIETARPIDEYAPVQIRANGKLIATGELVEIDKRVGVLISRWLKNSNS